MKCTKPTLFKAPNNYWRSSSNCVAFFESIRGQLKINDLSDWYNVTPQQISNCGGSTVLKDLGGSMYTALQTIYPQHKWIPWKFANVPKYFWSQESNRKSFFDHIQTELNISSYDDWYTIKNEDIHDQGGGTMMTVFYGNSLYKALSSLYPEHTWLPWKFQNGRVPSGYWNELSNQRRFFEWAAAQLGVKNSEGWYSVMPAQLQDLGGRTLLQKYNNNLYAALTQVFPEYPWQAWRFSQVPNGYWNSAQNIHQFIQECAEKLHITQLDDWYRVSLKQLHELGARYLVERYGGLPKVLQMVYPDHSWDFSNISTKKAAQRWLFITTQSVFGLSSEDVVEDFPHPLLKGLRLDVWIPSLSLALEYQGEQHFHDLKTFNSQRQYQEKDALKQQLCAINNIQLVAIPYWWDRTRISLLATLLHQQPHLQKYISPSLLPTSHVDVFVQTHRIPESPPKLFNKKQIMTPKEVALPTKQEYKGWWMAAQPSGVHLFWDASLKQFFLKSGKPIPKDTLASLLDVMPPFNVDGYLDASHLKGHPTKSPPLFHINDVADSSLPREARLEKIKQYLSQSRPQLSAVHYEACQGDAHLLEKLKQQKDHDGMLLKAPQSVYSGGVSEDCVLVKLYEEAQVTMVRVHPPTGHLLCQQDTGQHVFVRCGGDVISNPPSPGTKLVVQHTGTYKHSGRLKTPSFKSVANK